MTVFFRLLEFSRPYRGRIATAVVAMLVYGAASADKEPELDCLRADFGATQLRAFSQAEYKAYVQDLARTLDVGMFGAILLVGSNEMMVACRELLAHKNFPAEKIFSNY